MTFASLEPYGWDAGWASRLAEVADRGASVPGRIVRHEGIAVNVALPRGVESRPLRRGLTPAPVVGDWVAVRGDTLVAVLGRTSLLERRAGRRARPQPLAANVDVVLIACGLDRPLKDGRIERTATVAWEAGARPAVVLTKVDTVPGGHVPVIVEEVAAGNPGLDVVATSAVTGQGLDDLGALIGRSTVVVLGESGAGKSSLVNALLGDQVAPVGRVRRGDAKGRHTTTTRELHLVPGGGTIIDTPGIRSVAPWADTEAVATTYDDIDELALECRFSDCGHTTEPECAVRAAIESGRLANDRVERWRELEREAAATEVRRPSGRRKR